jgi:long-subunit acyl-CoA synthetase (AMP-forming)
VYGNSYENVLVAVVVPDKKALTAWASDNGLGGASFEELCDNSKVCRSFCTAVAARAMSPVTYLIRAAGHRTKHSVLYRKDAR